MRASQWVSHVCVCVLQKGASAVYDMVRSQPVKRKAEEPAREEEDEEEGCKRQRTLQDDSDSEREVTTLPFHLPTISQRLTQAGGCRYALYIASP